MNAELLWGREDGIEPAGKLNRPFEDHPSSDSNALVSPRYLHCSHPSSECFAGIQLPLKTVPLYEGYKR